MTWHNRRWLEADAPGGSYISFPPTVGGIESAVKELVPHVKRAECETIGAARAVVRVRVFWYAWLLFGILHWATRRRARKVIERFKAAGVRVDVRVR